MAEPTIVFLTVCAKDRERWLAQRTVHEALREIWSKTDAWLVGKYLLMPDHVHLFCAPPDCSFTLAHWVSRWKRKFSCFHLANCGGWQRHCWDTRLRRSENYAEKWPYVSENPIRAGLVDRAEDWPHQGEMNVLQW